jgi:hypothetical protein
MGTAIPSRCNQYCLIWGKPVDLAHPNLGEKSLEQPPMGWLFFQEQWSFGHRLQTIAALEERTRELTWGDWTLSVSNSRIFLGEDT